MNCGRIGYIFSCRISVMSYWCISYAFCWVSTIVYSLSRTIYVARIIVNLMGINMCHVAFSGNVARSNFANNAWSMFNTAFPVNRDIFPSVLRLESNVLDSGLGMNTVAGVVTVVNCIVGIGMRVRERRISVNV